MLRRDDRLRDDRPREERPRDDRPRREAPPQKSAEDLKDIIRATMAKQGQKKQEVVEQKQGNLKSALAEVIKKESLC